MLDALEFRISISTLYARLKYRWIYRKSPQVKYVLYINEFGIF